MIRARRSLALLAALVCTALPQIAMACPACVGDSGNNLTFLKLGALMSLVPFGIVAAVIWVLRQAPDGMRGR
jgi:hypothetical protein